jgi:hypothetical protein
MFRVAQDWCLVTVPHSTNIYPTVVLMKNAKQRNRGSLAPQVDLRVK